MIDVVESVLRARLSQKANSRPLVIGLCGAQGSGKSTLAAHLARRIERTGVLSLDDLYRTRLERAALARDVHPLLQTRGVPGTHDIALGLDVLASMEARQTTLVPRFDKALDERAPPEQWHRVPGDTQLVLVEGWCVGAMPQEEEALAGPINALERDEDEAGVWRRYVNTSLAAEYQQLFARIDILVLLAAPGFDTVLGWRTEQEHCLRASVGPAGTAVMSDAEVGRFIAHYERLTRHILSEMPGRADVTVRLDENRSVIATSQRAGAIAGARYPSTQPT